MSGGITMATPPQGNMEKWMIDPSDRLMAVFRASSRDPTREITTLRHTMNKFLQHCWDESAKKVATQCCRDAINWYWNILERLLNQECKKSRTRVSSILGFDLTQHLVAACSLEMVISANHLPCDFPELLRILQLSSYDFLKAAMMLLRAATDLHQTMVGHLVQLEEKILENLVWTSNSPLWEDIRSNEGRLPSVLQVMCPSRLHNPVKTDQTAQPDLPPTTGGSLGTSLRASSDMQSTHTPVKKFIHLFAHMAYTLMARRLSEMCATMHICDELQLMIWTCFEHSLVHYTFLMADRHLDQLLMCAIYITAKITQKDIPFRSIIKCYNSLRRTNKCVCKDVLITGGVMEDFTTANRDQSSAGLTPDTPSHYPATHQHERGNIIHFYNKVYIKTLQPFAQKFAPNFQGDTPPLSPYPRQKIASVCKQRLSGHHSIFISHLNTEIQALRKPAIFYIFSRSPRHRLHEINNMIRMGRPPNSLSYTTSADTQGEEEEGGDRPSVKRICLDDQSAWHRRLRDVVNDRVLNRHSGTAYSSCSTSQS